MNYTYQIVNADANNPVIHIHEVAALNKPGRVIDVLVGERDKQYLADFEQEIEEARLLERQAESAL